ncbi:MAG: hypothetical protein ACRDN0_02665, partial [Trebonia sp.]
SSANPVPDASSSAGAAGAMNGQSAANRNRFVGLGNAGGGTTVTHAAGGPSSWELAGLSLLGLLALVIIVPGCTRLVIRQRRWRAGARAGDAGLARAAWLELRDDLTDYGAGYSPSETPRALAARVAAAGTAFAPVAVPALDASVAGTVSAPDSAFSPDTAFSPDGAFAPDGAADAVSPAGVATLVSPADLTDAGLTDAGLAGADMDGDGDLIGAADLTDMADLAGPAGPNGNAADLDLSADPGAALRRVAMAAERARYSARPASGTALRADSAIVRRAIAASASRRTRWQARIFPSSVVAPVAIALSQATDAFGRLNLSRIQYRGKP